MAIVPARIEATACFRIFGGSRDGRVREAELGFLPRVALTYLRWRPKMMAMTRSSKSRLRSSVALPGFPALCCADLPAEGAGNHGKGLSR
jgi:hypothetical protein